MHIHRRNRNAHFSPSVSLINAVAENTPRRADSVSSLFHFFYSVLWHFGFTISEVLDIVLWLLQYERASWGDRNGLQTRRAPGPGIIKSTIGLDRQQPSMSRDTLKL